MPPSPRPVRQRRTALRALRALAVVGLLALLPATPALADPSASASPSPSESASASPSNPASTSPSPSTSSSASTSPSPSPHGLRAWFEPATADIYTTTRLVVTARDLPDGGEFSVLDPVLGYVSCTVTGPAPRWCGQPDNEEDSSHNPGCQFSKAKLVTCTFVLRVDPHLNPGQSVPQQVLLWPTGGHSSQDSSETTAYLTVGAGTASPSPSQPSKSPSASPSASRPASGSPTATRPGGLPVTGTSLTLYAGLAAALVAAGTTLVVLARRRWRS